MPHPLGPAWFGCFEITDCMYLVLLLDCAVYTQPMLSFLCFFSSSGLWLGTFS